MAQQRTGIRGPTGGIERIFHVGPEQSAAASGEGSAGCGRAAGSLAERTATGRAEQAASMASARPSTNSTGPPWLAVWVARSRSSCFSQVRRRAASATRGRRAGPVGDGGRGRTQARSSRRRRRRMKPARSRRGLVRPVKSNSPGSRLVPVPGDGKLHRADADGFQPDQLALPELAGIEVVRELDGLHDRRVSAGGRRQARARRRPSASSSRRGASERFGLSQSVILDQGHADDGAHFK